MSNGNRPDPRGIVGKRSTMRLSVHLGDEDVAKRSGELSKVVREYDELLSDRRNRLKALRERRTELAAVVHSRSEMVDVEVVEHLVVETRTVEIVRVDDGTVVSTRPATGEDRQLMIDGPARVVAADGRVVKDRHGASHVGDDYEDDVLHS